MNSVNAIVKKVSSLLKVEVRKQPARQTAPSTLSYDAAADGDRARDAGNWPEAILHYQAHLEHHPEDAAIHVQLGHAFKETGQYSAARASYRMAARLTPRDADLFLQIGHLAKLMDDRPSMIAAYARSFQLDPDQPDPYIELLAYAPRTPRGWLDADVFEKTAAAPPTAAAPTEPVVCCVSPAEWAEADPIRAAMDTVRIARTVRAKPVTLPLSDPERDYALMKLAVFNSSYEGAVDVFAALAGLSGVKPDQSIEPYRSFAFGAVPMYRISNRMREQPTPLLKNYQRMQVAASKRFILQPDRKGSVVGGPLISVLLPVYRGPAIYVERAILSVILQTYNNIQLCIVDDCSQRDDIKSLLSYYAAQDPRITVDIHETNRGIAEATNTALRAAKGDYFALLDHDDMIAHDALEVVAGRLSQDPDADLIYSDECTLDCNDIVAQLLTKPDWSPTLLQAVMYTGHLSVYRKSLVNRIGNFRSKYDFSQDYDLALRVAETEPRVIHIGECLYGWRMIPGSAAQGGKPLARLSNVAALQDAAERRHINGRVLGLPFANRIRGTRTAEPPLISLIIPSDNEANILSTLASIQLMSSYPNIEILVVTNTDCANTCRLDYPSPVVKYVGYDKPFNFSDKCNEGARAACGKYLIFFNDDVRVRESEWLDAILEVLELPGVGIVGPKLLYENGAIQHAGMITGVRTLIGTAFHTFPEQTAGHFCFAQSTREVSLICGACLAINADVFESVGGFDAVNTPIAHSDVDLCFKVRATGLTCVYTPYATLTHIGHLSIGAAKKSQRKKKVDKADIFLLRRWGSYCAYDPYFPPGMRDVLYIDSAEPFDLYVGNRQTVIGGSDVLIVSHDLSGSGAPKVAYDIAEYLVSQGHYVMVVSPEDGPFRARLLAIGVDVMIDPLIVSGENKTFLGFARNFDLVIANTIVTWAIVNQLAQVVRVVWYVHETELVGHLARAHPALGQNANAATVWAGSRRAAEALRSIGISSTIIEYGVQPLDLHGEGSRSDKTIISVLATYEPRKGQDLALLAFKELSEDMRSECELRFAGRINDKPFYDALQSMDRAKLVQHLGELSLEEYASAMASTDIVLCPSRDDTLPLVSLDALANGKILICSAATGTSEYFRNGESGYIAASSAPVDIAATLRLALSDRANWPSISAAGKAVFSKHFSKAKFQANIREHLHLKNGAGHQSLLVQEPVL